MQAHKTSRESTVVAAGVGALGTLVRGDASACRALGEMRSRSETGGARANIACRDTETQQRHTKGGRQADECEAGERRALCLVNEVADLRVAAAAGGVADGPGRLLLDLELRGGEQVDERRDDLRVDDGLDLP